MKKITIEIGNERKKINKIGSFIVIIGILLFLSAGIILYAGTYLPLEIKIVYYFEVISRNIYLTFLASIILLIGGFKLLELKKFNKSTFVMENDQISFTKGNEIINLPTKKIHKFIWNKKYFTSHNYITIKTIGLKKYETRMDTMNFSRLRNFFPNKDFEFKTLGNNGYHK